MLDESLERAEPIGLLLHAIGTNGGLTGARSIHSMINGSAGDTDDTPSAPTVSIIFYSDCSLLHRSMGIFVICHSIFYRFRC